MRGTYAYSLDRESFTGIYNTRQEAFTAGCRAADRLNANVNEIYVGQRVMGDPQANLHAWEIIRDMRSRARATAGDDARAYLAHVTEDQARDLDGALEAVVLRWLANYKLGPTFFRIEAISEHPIPTVAHCAASADDGEVSELGESEWR
ncbi:MAG TPA: hypothetical protein VER17_03350 [Tepidisphaeraceae bacterium]|nr:hypothetical protein [Tepidisphaeraceae bacterium]